MGVSFLLAAFCERMGRGILPLAVEGVQDFVLGIYRVYLEAIQA
jgi:hypothetical protein